MGIKGLTQLLQAKAPNCMREKPFDAFTGQKVAIDASMSLYQFLIAIRQQSNDGSSSYFSNLTSSTGEVTSHLQGMFYRTLKMLDSGIKPCYVFDGRSELAKSSELQKRRDKRDQSMKQLEQAIETGNQDEIEKHTKTTTVVTQQQANDCKHLLQLMGLPIVQAAGEAEAQCAALCKANIVYATATEDMDALTFGSPRLVRNLTFTFSGTKQKNAVEFDLQRVLQGLGLDMSQFIDVCILCGCDFASKLKGIGPNSAYDYIVKYGSLEKVIEYFKSSASKIELPDGWEQAAKEAQEIFKNPIIIDPKEIKIEWTEPRYDELIKYLVEDKGFDLNRVKNGCERLKKYRSKHSGTQSRMESFFTMTIPNKSTTVKKEDSKPTKKKNFGTLGARGPTKKKKLMDDSEDTTDTTVKDE